MPPKVLEMARIYESDGSEEASDAIRVVLSPSCSSHLIFKLFADGKATLKYSNVSCESFDEVVASRWRMILVTDEALRRRLCEHYNAFVRMSDVMTSSATAIHTLGMYFMQLSEEGDHVS